MTQFKPHGKRVLIKQVEPPKTYKNTSIILPDAQVVKEDKGIVIAIGPDVEGIEIGSMIQFSAFASPMTVPHNDEDHLLLRDEEIIGTIVEV